MSTKQKPMIQVINYEIKYINSNCVSYTSSLSEILTFQGFIAHLQKRLFLHILSAFQQQPYTMY
jgi:hypothetical protein